MDHTLQQPKNYNPEQTKEMNEFSDPLDFILMKEEFVMKNPTNKKAFIKEITVESKGELFIASVITRLVSFNRHASQWNSCQDCEFLIPIGVLQFDNLSPHYF